MAKCFSKTNPQINYSKIIMTNLHKIAQLFIFGFSKDKIPPIRRKGAVTDKIPTVAGINLGVRLSYRKSQYPIPYLIPLFSSLTPLF